MKKNITIVVFVILSNLLALKSIAQDSTGTILADDTRIVYTDKGAKIECDNDKVFYKLFTTHYQLIQRFTSAWKTNGKTMWKHYVVYLSKGDAEIIKSWAKSNL
jgi:hypothetical protein